MFKRKEGKMKKLNLKLNLFLVLLTTILLLPLNAHAKEEYKTLNLKEALAEEEIDEAFDNYEENNDQITIYLFRGKGCAYCRAYLEFMNSITDEYGKYFKLQSYEVWNDENNAALMDEVSNYLDQPASGVPYIIIGDKVFAGYSEEYDDDIKEAIKSLYDEGKEDRYDVFKEMEKNPKTTEETKTSSSSNIIWNLVFIIIATAFITIFTNYKFNKLNEKIDNLDTKKRK